MQRQSQDWQMSQCLQKSSENSRFFAESPNYGTCQGYNKDRLKSKEPPSLSENHYLTHYRRFHRLLQGMPGKTAAVRAIRTNVRTEHKE